MFHIFLLTDFHHTSFGNAKTQLKWWKDSAELIKNAWWEKNVYQEYQVNLIKRKAELRFQPLRYA